MRICVVGSGLAGATACARLVAAGHKVTVFETRPHVAGNCYDEVVGDSIVHRYGPHNFHTNSDQVFSFLSLYTSWLGHTLRVKAKVSDGSVIPIPFNHLSESIVGQWTLERIREELFIPYSEKQWGVPWQSLPESITKRVPVKREGYDDRYFTDKYQCLPKYGYTEMVNAMLEGAEVVMAAGKKDWKSFAEKSDLTIYTGKPDDLVERESPLPYRSLRFEYQTVARDDSRPMQLNQCNRLTTHTREINHSLFPTAKIDGSARLNDIIHYEYSEEHVEGKNHPFYPESHKVSDLPQYLEKVKAYAQDHSMILCGRLGAYRYMDMDVVVATTLKAIEHLTK